nr:hypothetical protein [uncultured Sphaerochaeta sp.]
MAKAQFSLKKRIKLVEQCFEFIGTGQPVCRFADSIGIPRTTLYGWLRHVFGQEKMDKGGEDIFLDF